MTRCLDRIIVVMIKIAGVDSLFASVSFILFLEKILKRVLLLFVIVAPLIKERNQKFPKRDPRDIESFNK